MGLVLDANLDTALDANGDPIRDALTTTATGVPNSRIYGQWFKLEQTPIVAPGETGKGIGSGRATWFSLLRCVSLKSR